MGDWNRSALPVIDGHVRIDSHQLVDRGDDVAGRDRVIDRVAGLLVGLAEHRTVPHPASGQQAEAALGPVLAAGVGVARGGAARGKEVVKAQDLDVKGKLVPFGILEVPSGVMTIIFGTSRETSDFLVDCMEQWWQERKASYGHILELVINMDNGPE